MRAVRIALLAAFALALASLPFLHTRAHVGAHDHDQQARVAHDADAR